MTAARAMGWATACLVWAASLPLGAAPPVAERNLEQDARSMETLRDRARELYGQGLELMQGGDFPAAAAKFEAAFALVPVPTLGLAWARALEKLGKLVSAHELYERIPQLTWPEELPALPQLEAQATALDEGSALEARIRRAVFVSPAPSPKARPADASLTRTLGWTALSLGGLGLVVNAAGLVYSSRFGNPFPWGRLRCEPEDCARLNSWRTVFNASLVAGTTLALTGGGILLFTNSNDDGSTAVGVSLAPHSVSIVAALSPF